ncbi:MAG: hypothetical protein JRN20_20360, partial [Nitrososphaerota archaeon]|nr:hypothetical protein [Nitrososphaerota archaeon]
CKATGVYVDTVGSCSPESYSRLKKGTTAETIWNHSREMRCEFGKDSQLTLASAERKEHFA